MSDKDTDFSEVKTLLESDLDDFEEQELDELYNDIQEYSRYAEAHESANEPDNAQYYKELAVETYQTFADVIQMKKGLED